MRVDDGNPYEMKHKTKEKGTTCRLRSPQGRDGGKKKGEVMATSPPPFP